MKSQIQGQGHPDHAAVLLFLPSTLAAGPGVLSETSPEPSLPPLTHKP